MSARPIIRARRYVSAPAGTYPEPLGPAPSRAASAPSAVEDPFLGVSEPADASVEDQHGPEPLLMGSAAGGAPSGVIVEDLGFDESADDGDLPLLSGPVDDEAPEAAAQGSSSRASGGLVILVSGLVGVVIGAIAGLALLAFMEPAQWMERFLDPIGLWTSTPDPLIRASAIMIVVGCGLIGALLPLRLRR